MTRHMKNESARCDAYCTCYSHQHRLSAADRRRIAGGQAYEVSYFARKHGLTAAEARDIIKQARGNREKANKLAQRKR